MPKTELRLQKLPWLFAVMATKDFFHAALNPAGPQPTATISEVRSALTNPTNLPPRLRSNQVLGGPIRQEDSPGKYVVREGTNGVEVLCYDYDDAEHRLDF